MKKLITLTITLVILLSSVAYADADRMTFDRVITDKHGITAIVLKDELRGLKIEFKYYDKLNMIKVYQSAKYTYDYTDDILVIVDKNGKVIYNNED